MPSPLAGFACAQPRSCAKIVAMRSSVDDSNGKRPQKCENKSFGSFAAWEAFTHQNGNYVCEERLHCANPDSPRFVLFYQMSTAPSLHRRCNLFRSAFNILKRSLTHLLRSVPASQQHLLCANAGCARVDPLCAVQYTELHRASILHNRRRALPVLMLKCS